MSLNQAQAEAVATLSGPLLVLAGAGTGKTRVVTHRIAELIKSGIRPSRILAVTFTNKAANEMQERAKKILGKLPDPKDKPHISTFHSLCVQILRRRITLLGYPSKFAIYDRGDQESLARGVLREIKGDQANMRPSDLLGCISFWKTRGMRPAEAAAKAESDKDHLASAGYRRYQEALRLSGAVDFDDILLLVEDLFRTRPDIREEEAARYDHVLVDEYQDTNAVQYRIVRALSDKHRNLCVVGDDDQSIYGWRGAEVAHILNFAKDWPEAKVVRLEDNYRCRGPILELANTLIAYNRKRHGKVLRSARGDGPPPRILQFKDEENEAENVVAEIHSKVSAKLAMPGDFAILFRTNDQPRHFETELRKRQVPYTLVGGQSFYDRKEVRDLLAYFRVLVQPRDEVALLRIINTPPRGIGASTVETLLDVAVKAGRPVWEAVCSAHEMESLSNQAKTAVDNFRRMMDHFRSRLQRETPLHVAQALIQQIDYRSEVTRNYSNNDEQLARWSNVEEVVNAIAKYQSEADRPAMSEFLGETMLAGDKFQQEKEGPTSGAVNLMTLHSAKGLEFSYVYLVGLEENILPHKRSVEADDGSIEEERRLCYVGVTRAIDTLTLSFCQTRMKWGKPQPTVPSRFLFEMKGEADHPRFREAMKRAAEAGRSRGGGSKFPPKKKFSPKGKRPPSR